VLSGHDKRRRWTLGRCRSVHDFCARCADASTLLERAFGLTYPHHVVSTPRLVSSGADHALGEVSGHLIGVWDGAVSLESVQRWRRQIESLVRASPGRVVYLSYERSGFQMPSDAVRKLIADTLRNVDGKLAACAVVLPGHSFASAAVRALVSGIAMVAKIASSAKYSAAMTKTMKFPVRFTSALCIFTYKTSRQ